MESFLNGDGEFLNGNGEFLNGEFFKWRVEIFLNLNGVL